jgi:hypothetical protein
MRKKWSRARMISQPTYVVLLHQLSELTTPFGQAIAPFSPVLEAPRGVGPPPPPLVVGMAQEHRHVHRPGGSMRGELSQDTARPRTRLSDTPGVHTFHN